MSLFVASARPELFKSTHQTSITSDFGGMNPREADISRRLHALRIRVYALRQGLFIRSEWLRLRAKLGRERCKREELSWSRWERRRHWAWRGGRAFAGGRRPRMTEPRTLSMLTRGTPV